MDTTAPQDAAAGLDSDAHLRNVADNLKLVADLGYGDAALALPDAEGVLRVAADARPDTAVAAFASSRVGRTLTRGEETEAYEALDTGRPVRGGRRRTTRGISFETEAWPVIGSGPAPIGVIIRDLTQQVLEAPGRMERSSMRLAEGLVGVLTERAIMSDDTGAGFSTTRRAGDGVLELTLDGVVTYASPNAVNIVRSAGAKGQVTETIVGKLPGVADAVAALLGREPGSAHATDVDVAERVLRVRAIVLEDGLLVLVQDVTDARRREREIRVKEATIREVHHRVKNNLQTVASLLRIQARRSDTEAARRALYEAVERISSMAVVHEKLATAGDESVDFAEVARIVADMVRLSLAGSGSQVAVSVEGSTGDLPAPMATSLALVTAELVHNAIEHGLGEAAGEVHVVLRRLPGEVHLVVRDTGVGLPEGFDQHSSAGLGLTIVDTVVGQDLHGTLSFSGGRGTTVTVRVPMPADDGKEA
jgi:two-component sensor histidine kinase